MNPLQKMVTKRLAAGVLTIVVVSILIFVGVEALPGDPATAILGQQATPENLAALRKELKLDLPPHIRYFSWLGAVARGDLGRSLTNQRPVSEMIGWRFSNTLFLAAAAAAVSVPLAIILGMLAALYRDSWLDRLLSISSLSAISFPEFFVGYILIAVFAIKLGILPGVASIHQGMTFGQKLASIVLPTITLMLVVLAHMMRMTRAAIIGILTSPYIEMAKLKGIGRGRIIYRHAVPNALAPIINVVIMDLAWLVVGVVVVEVVFVYPGLGQLLVDAVSKRDLPVVQASGIIFACTYIMLNLTADVLAILTNPKLRTTN
ncbi:MAG: ABC transporter permease [Desulfosarcina sp.]|nr:ABC transporter permease [Desulfosarcina sp.]MBC2764753.1 ABC transporter permease [Desulfosarcina sp.]